MRISDWSSDVCSSDLIDIHAVKPGHPQPYTQFPGVILTIGFDDSSVMFDHFMLGFISPAMIDDAGTSLLSELIGPSGERQADWFQRAEEIGDEISDRHTRPLAEDRKSVVWGKRVAGRVDLGGRRY